jgi:hypothetical protein
MPEKPSKFGEQLASARTETRHLITSVLLDQWPNNSCAAAFGVHSHQHYESLYFPIRNQELTPKQLDAAIGDGLALTALVRDAPSNPHKEIEFQTLRSMLAKRYGPETQPTNENAKELEDGIER